MIGRWKFVFVAFALPLILFVQTSLADSDHDRLKKHHRRHHRHHRHHRGSSCAKSASGTQQLEKIPEDSILPSWPLNWGPMARQPRNYPLSGVGGGRTCTNTIPTLVQLMPPERANCFARLFYKENNACSPHTLISPAQGNNPHWGIGLCTLELSPSLRRGRPAACADISTMAKQVACCVGIYEQTRGRYFGPINRGEVPRC